jgi:lysophospholipase L1-like esterase
MTIQMLATWNGLEEEAVVTLASGAEETRLIGLGLARNYVAGMDGRNPVLSNAEQAATQALVSKYGKRKIGTRILHHRFGTFNDASLNTWHVTAEMAAPFDAVRLVLANTDNTSARYYACAVSVLPSAADLNNSGGTWLQAGQGIDSTVTVPNAVKTTGGNRVSYAVSNWIPLASVARSDSGTYPLLAVRARNLEANASLPVYGNGTDDLTNWATRTTGRLWCSRVQAVDAVTTPASFTSTTNVSQSAVVGIQYIARGRVITVMGCSDSIGSGRGTFIGEGYGLPACDALQTALGIPIEYADASWAGQNSGLNSGAGYLFRALDILRSPIRPDVMFTAIGSPNDTPSPPTTQALIDRMRYMRELVVQEASERGTGLLLSNILPTNNSVLAYGSSDSLRVAYNSECAAAYVGVRGVEFVDLANPLNGTTHASGQIQINAAFSSDGIHPNDAGNAVLRPIAQAGLSNLLLGV